MPTIELIGDPHGGEGKAHEACVTPSASQRQRQIYLIRARTICTERRDRPTPAR
jgi:hypothetical protein